ncbi:MAG: response regulator [Cyclobacteriaceae bacterium]
MLILNVDDDRDDREFFSDAIKEVDPSIPCVLFENGQELLYYLEEAKTLPDYIFIDINMPKMNGYECAQEIRSNYLTGETQIVMYSTAFNPADKAKFKEQGFKYIVKQNSLGELVQSIKGVMSKGVFSYNLL